MRTTYHSGLRWRALRWWDSWRGKGSGRLSFWLWFYWTLTGKYPP